MDEVLLIDKPAGWTSFDVVAKIRNTLQRAVAERPEICGCELCKEEQKRRASGGESQRVSTGSSNTAETQQSSRSSSAQPSGRARRHKVRVGHAGTLDPFATGLLIVLVGKATKRQDEFMGLDKTYEFTIRLGQTSTTGDPEGEIKEVKSRKFHLRQGFGGQAKVERSEVEQVLESFVGEIKQTPPAHSAIKINGQRAYKLARAGKEVEMPTRQVTIHTLELLSYDYPAVKCVATVSKGTYIRTLAADIGQALGVGGYCSQLRRTRIGSYHVEPAVAPDQSAEQLFVTSVDPLQTD